MYEPSFQNRFSQEKETIKEIISHFLLKTRIMKAVYICIPVFVLCNIILTFLSSEYLLLQQILLIGFLVSLIFIGLGILETKIKNTPKYADQSMANISINNESIDWKLGDKTKIFKTRKIFAFFETENYIVIIPNVYTSTLVILKKSAFMTGTSDEFISFLKSKAIRCIK